MSELTTIDPKDPEAIVEGIIPYFPDDRGKTNYLSYRSCGFAEREACKLANVSQRSVQRWRHDDPVFHRLDTEGLSELRAKVSTHYLQMEFTRNFRMLLDVDRAVIYRKLTARNPLSKEDNDYLAKIRPMYTPAALSSLEIAIAPEGMQVAGSVNVQVSVNGVIIDTEEARRAAARQLLNRFASNNDYIEAEVREVS